MPVLKLLVYLILVIPLITLPLAIMTSLLAETAGAVSGQTPPVAEHCRYKG